MNAFCVAVDVEIVERKCKTHLNRRILTVFSADQGRLGSLASWRFTREDHAARHRLRIRPVHDLEQKARATRRRALALSAQDRAQAIWMLWFLSGNERMRWLVALKNALSTAGAATATVGSPTPPQNPPDGMMIVSTLGIWASRIIS